VNVEKSSLLERYIVSTGK